MKTNRRDFAKCIMAMGAGAALPVPRPLAAGPSKVYPYLGRTEDYNS